MMTTYQIGDRVRRPDAPNQTGTIATIEGACYGVQMCADQPGSLWVAGAGDPEPVPDPIPGDRVLVDGFPFGERPGTLVEITPDAVVGDGPTLWVILDPTLDDLVAGVSDEDLADPIPFRLAQVRAAS